jgi:hypothetical protein
MNDALNVRRRPLVVVGLFLLGSSLFSAAYCQAPLYYSNQNQYFLHGLATAGEGFLRDDWLAKTADPTPLFSGMVEFTAQYAHPWLFHFYHALLQGIYAAALLGIFTYVVGPDTAARRWPVFAAILFVVHSALARWASYRLFGLDYPWYFQAGVAGQYVLGAMLQPSVFGVLLVAAVSLFVNGRPYTAVAALAAGATIHTTYLLPGALLTAGFLAARLRAASPQSAARMAGFALLLVAPATAFVVLRFSPTSPETFAEAQEILVYFRIPHHARPDLWIDPIAGLQIAWLVLALALVWGTDLFLTLAVPFALAAVLTILQATTGHHTLALLFPWRVSSILVPIATAIIASRLVAIRALPFDGKAAIAGAVVALLVAAGLWINFARLAFRGADEEAGLVHYVRESRSLGDVYLLPVRVPDLARTTRGSLSGDFKPLAAKRADTRLIPVDLQRFRLATGVPIFVDFKSIPYKDVDVIEWRERLALAEGWQKDLRAGRPDKALLEMLEPRSGQPGGITHVVEPAGQDIAAAGLRKVYEDEFYQVYRLDNRRAIGR